MQAQNKTPRPFLQDPSTAFRSRPTRMQAETAVHMAAGLLIAIFTVFAIAGLRQVPFHPDESTQLFMSSDWDLLLTHPTQMAWNPLQGNDLRQRYRELDAPLTRYLLGAGRSLAGLPPLAVDWDWSKGWEANRQAGALPTPQLLFAGRMAVTLLLPFSLALLYLIARSTGGSLNGLLAILLLGSNALVLLHTRRAMAEGMLLFGVCLALAGFLHGDKRPWLAGLGLAVAFNAKQSALALLPAGLLAVAWLAAPAPRPWRKVGLNLATFTVVFGLLTLALNPLLWRNPLPAALRAWEARQELLARQVEGTRQLAPGQLLSSPGQRAAALLANLYLVPPAFAEIGNYRAETRAAEAQYLAIPGNNLLRSLAGGGSLLVLTVFGVLVAGLRFRKENNPARRMLAILGLATLSLAAGLIVTVPLPWQRYVVPLLPLMCLWIAYGAGAVVGSLNKKRPQG